MDNKKLSIIIQAQDGASRVFESVNNSIKDSEQALSTATTSAQDYSDGLKKASLVTGAAGAALTLYAKSATDKVVAMTKSAKALASQTGDTAEQSSKLLAVFDRMGISGGETSQMFGLLSKQIAESRNKASDAALKQDELRAKIRDVGLETSQLNNKIQAANIQIQKYTDEISAHGDANGALTNKIQSLRFQVQGYENDLSDATNKTKEYNQQLTDAAGPLDKLHISTVNADGSARSFNDILLDIADGFKALPASAEKTALSMELFGRSGKDMIKVLNLGSAGIKQLEADADKLGLTLSQKNIADVSSYIASQKKLKESTDSLKVSVGLLTAPVLTEFNQKLADMEKHLIGADAPMRKVTSTVLAFGGPVLGATSAATAFVGNLASAGPILSKLPALLNPATLAVIGTTAAIAAATVGVVLLVKRYKEHQQAAIEYAQSNDTISRSVQQFTDLANTLGVTVQGTAAKVSFLELAEKDLATTKEMVKVATDNLTASQATLKAGQDNLVVSTQNVSGAQAAVQAALDQFGANSPQYTQAVADLDAITYAYNQKLLSNFGLQVNVQTATDNLTAARNLLAGSTAELSRVEAILNGGLDSGLKTIANFGPIASQQVGAIATLQNVLNGVVQTFNGFSGSLQAQVPKINQQLGGISNALQIYQGQSDQINRSLSQSASYNPQGSSVSIQGKRASGGPVTAGKTYLVGEHEPELFVPNQSGRILNGEQIKDATAPSSVFNIFGPINLQSADAVDRFFERQNSLREMAQLGAGV